MKIAVILIIVIVVLAAAASLMGMFERPSPTPTPTPTPILPAPSPTTKPVVTLTAEELIVKAKTGEVKVGDTVRVVGEIDHSNLKNDVIKVGEGMIVLWRGMFALAPTGKRVTIEGKITFIGKNSIDLEEARLMGDP